MTGIRKEMIEKRKMLEDRSDKDHRICARFFDELSDRVKRVFIYYSYGAEADTRAIVARLISEGREVYLPAVTGKTTMVFFRISDTDSLKPGAYGVPEPEPGLASAAPEYSESDIMVVPGTVFDEYGGRFGYGGGFYDRYLCAHPVKTVALSYECQVIRDPLPLKEHDVRMERLITEEKLRVWKE